MLTGRVLRGAPAVAAQDTEVAFDRCEPGMSAEQRGRPAPLVPHVVISLAGTDREAFWLQDGRAASARLG